MENIRFSFFGGAIAQSGPDTSLLKFLDHTHLETHTRRRTHLKDW